MARLRQLDTGPANCQDSQSTDASVLETATIAFANMNDLAQPTPLIQTQQEFAQIFKAPSLNQKQGQKALICKKSSPRKDVRKQIHLKPMGFSAQDEDLSLMTVRREWDDEVRQRPKRTFFSPTKIVLPETSSNSSMQSMISDSDQASELSLPVSFTSARGALELDAKIPSNLISDTTSRQLFSPAKPRNVSMIDFDTMVDALASTRIEDCISEVDIEDDTDYQPPIRSFPSLLAPTLLPPLTARKIQPTSTRPSTPPLVSPCKTTIHKSNSTQHVTPPVSPTKSRLVSPSKQRYRVPTPPPTSSPNGFWSVEKVNEWNEQFSPQKIVRSPKKSRVLLDDEDTSPSTSPRKLQSPSKLTREELSAKRDFESRKKEIAVAFLVELDEKITDGQIANIAESTGGVELIWSKTLNSTAGRANWRRETKSKRNSNDEKITESKHFASIELAEKVIDNEERLLNVLAHEFCHLANFMVSGIKDRPHGAEFKAWGQKCSATFRDRGVKVTTKHTYDIDYKYIWACINDDCQAEFKRHSKSIDPARHTCGVCRDKLVQIKPVPRKTASGKVTGYAGFVKEHFAAVREEMPGASQKEIMAKIGEKYRETKKEALEVTALTSVDLDAVAEDLERVKLDE